MTTRAGAAGLAVVIGVAALAGACKRRGDDGEWSRLVRRDASVLTAGDRVAYEALTAELAAARRALLGSQVPRFNCEAAAVSAEAIAGERDPLAVNVITEFERLCGREVPMAAVEEALARVAEARTSGPVPLVALECARADRAAHRLQAEHGSERAVADLLARLEAACPDSASE